MPHRGPVLIADVPDLEAVLRACFLEDDVVYVSPFHDAVGRCAARHRYAVLSLGAQAFLDFVPGPQVAEKICSELRRVTDAGVAPSG